MEPIFLYSSSRAPNTTRMSRSRMFLTGPTRRVSSDDNRNIHSIRSVDRAVTTVRAHVDYVRTSIVNYLDCGYTTATSCACALSTNAKSVEIHGGGLACIRATCGLMCV